MQRFLNRRWMLVLVAVAVVCAVSWMMIGRGTDATPVDLTQVMNRIQAGEVAKVQVSSDGRTARVTYSDASSDKVVLPPGQAFTSLLTDAHIATAQWPPIELAPTSAASTNAGLLIRLGTFAVLGLAVILILRKFTPGSLSNSSRKGGFEPIKAGERVVTFDDVAGCEEVKEEVQDVIDFLRDPDRFRELGARIPRGLLLSGPPGTGKTLIARALAGEARASFFSVSASEFVELYVGVGASRVRELFRRARENAPAIVFIDEIDAIGRRRGRMEQSSEYDQTLNQILVELDGFEERTTVVVVAATNRVDILDSALLRPGRFDRKVMVDLPDRTARRAILEVHGRGKPFDADVVFDEIAARTTGMTGADLSNVINEAAILAARKRRPKILMADLFEALDRTIAGPARNSRRFSEQERRVIAYHEAGHAVVAHLLPHADTVRKVSIVSRGRAGGYTMIVPDEDRGLWTRAQLSDRLAALLGGLAAEELTFGDITTGSSNDLEHTTSIASSMVQRYGMSSRFGLFSTANGAEAVGLSPQSAFTAEQETLQIVAAAHDLARHVLTTHCAELEKVAQRLLEVETIEGDELGDLIGTPGAIVFPVEPTRPAVAPAPHTPSVARNRGKRMRVVGRAVAAFATFARRSVEGAVVASSPAETDHI
jgi:cell division protease FtsH